LAAGVGGIAEWSVEGFGSSDCACPSHLFAMKANPMTDRRFVDLMLHFRMGRLVEALG
jgi:sugar fermentation stimulation protein A